MAGRERDQAWSSRLGYLKAHPEGVRQVRGGSEFEWVKTHTYRKTAGYALKLPAGSIT